MNKKLDTTTIQRDLEGSAFFRPRATPASSTPSSPTPVGQTRAEEVHPVPPVRAVPPVPPTRPVKRVMKQRQPFDIYQDQYDALRELALEERKQGGVGSMS